jgi:antitoxin ParD1/3/4
MLETSETRLDRLRRLLEEGEQSGFEEYSYDALVAELDDESH